ncbi:MAG TPA: hypothetical protein VFY29_20465, partial [Terriglobia bacterium]|nr:hypothetical protein [Terriglobia bacterium]
GVISGTLRDEDGYPITGIQVQALTYDYRNGQRVFKTVGSARTTDDSGGFRLYYLAPGDYYVTARPTQGARGRNNFTGGFGGAGDLQGIQDLIQGLRGARGGQNFGNRTGGGPAAPAGAGGRGAGAPAGRGGPDQQVRQRGGGTQNFQDFIQNRGGGGIQNAGPAAPATAEPQEAYAPAYYPGTIDPAQAAIIHLAPGAEVSGIDFNIRPVPLVTLSGVVLQAVGTAAAAPAPSTQPSARGAQTPTPAARGAAPGGTQTGRGATGERGAAGAGSPTGTNNTLQALQELFSGARGGAGGQQNLQGLISGLRETINSNGGIAALLNDLGGNGRASVSLIPIGVAGRGGWAQNSGSRASVNDDGAFQIPGVTPGAYNLVASARSDAGLTTALQRVDVGFGGNITGLALQLRPAIVVPGQIYVDGQTPENFRTQSVRIQLDTVDDLPSGNARAQVNADGSFRIENVIPGAQYRVNMSSIQGGGYLQAGRYGGVNALNAPFAIADEGTPLQLQIGFTPGRIEAVVKEGDTIVPGALTALIPNDRGRIDLYRTVNSDKDGKVAFSDVPPGDYKLFAWEEIQSGAWQDPVVMERFEDRGRVVHVEKAGSSSENIQIVRSETRF